jgi:6-phosphofructokinase
MVEDSTSLRRVCILSGGGDAPGVNAIVRGFVHATRQFSLEVIGSRYGFEGLLTDGGLTPLSVKDVHGILPRGGCILGCSTRTNPFFMASGGTTRDVGPVIVDRLRSMGIEGLVLIGGDGTMLAAERFAELGMGCIGIPKTIDNDLGGTELTCGFDSAVEAASHAVDVLHTTAEAHARVMIVEVMGRNAGFIALHAGMAGGADVVLIPEIPYRLERVIAKVREREALGLRFSIIVIAEGARPVDGNTLEMEPGRPGHLPRLGGAGERLLHDLEEANLGHEVRLTVLWHLQRGGPPSALDRILGTQLGSYAASLCHRRDYNRRVVIREGRLASTALAHGESKLHKFVDLEGPLARSARLVGIELGDAPPAPAAGWAEWRIREA